MLEVAMKYQLTIATAMGLELLVMDGFGDECEPREKARREPPNGRG